ncbi:hypothetical protein DRF65_22635 [Chryseobacterium pennae]|uniref:Uncharacterized protein n=1 Tax=Chryseobacterium pennae TaxID=2258962 RepID=A0A3D9C2R8_9FLAO|nr:hypothetical protein DRF65_22635 [Chryseobacterium pennae]
MIANCTKIAEKEGITQRQSYKRVSKQLLRDAYFGPHPRRQKRARMVRKLPESILRNYLQEFEIYRKALTQERGTKDKIYSLHEPQVVNCKRSSHLFLKAFLNNS